jgi:hypothetical protein
MRLSCWSEVLATNSFTEAPLSSSVVLLEPLFLPKVQGGIASQLDNASKLVGGSQDVG